MIELIIATADEFVSLTLTVIPYFAIGVIVGALLATYTPKDFASKRIGDGVSGVIKATLLGALLPGCACATIPMARGLKETGAKLGVVSAFIMVSPLLSPHTLILNYGMLGTSFTVARVVASLAAALMLGLALNYLERKRFTGFVTNKTPESSAAVSSCSDDSCVSETEVNVSFWTSAKNITLELGKYFALGLLIASALSALVPEGALGKYIGASGVWAYASAVAVGIPLYVCEGEEIPITLSLLKLGLGPGPALSFLLGSVGTCIPTIIMAQKIIGKRPVLLYVISWVVFAVGFGLLFQGYFALRAG